MKILDSVRNEAKEFSNDSDASIEAVRFAYVRGAKSVINKWKDVLYDLVVATADTRAQADQKLKELGLK